MVGGQKGQWGQTLRETDPSLGFCVLICRQRGDIDRCTAKAVWMIQGWDLVVRKQSLLWMEPYWIHFAQLNILDSKVAQETWRSFSLPSSPRRVSPLCPEWRPFPHHWHLWGDDETELEARMTCSHGTGEKLPLSLRRARMPTGLQEGQSENLNLAVTPASLRSRVLNCFIRWCGLWSPCGRGCWF